MAQTNLIGNKKAGGAAATKAAAAPVKKEQRWYRVMADKQVPRTGGHDLLRAGKEITSANFDVELLRKQGVSLEEIEPPAWFVDQQEQSLARHDALVAEGHDLGEHPEYKPAAVRTAAKAPAAAT